MKLIDLSRPIENNMPVYPGDDRTELFQSKYLDVDKYNDYRLDTGMHSGTHIDSPMHLTEYSGYISEAPLDSFVADGCILDVRNRQVIEVRPGYDELVKENSIVLLYTGWDGFYGLPRYYREHPVIDTGMCQFLIHKKIKMLGVDMPSPDQYPFPIHKMLFESRIYLIENLTNLEKLCGAGDFEVIALPLRIKADSSMSRVVARIASSK